MGLTGNIRENRKAMRMQIDMGQTNDLELLKCRLVLLICVCVCGVGCEEVWSLPYFLPFFFFSFFCLLLPYPQFFHSFISLLQPNTYPSFYREIASVEWSSMPIFFFVFFLQERRIIGFVVWVLGCSPSWKKNSNIFFRVKIFGWSEKGKKKKRTDAPQLLYVC